MKKKQYQPTPILNPPPAIVGVAQILLSRDRLWPDLEAAGVDLSDVDRMASAFEYLNFWYEEAKDRFPDTTFIPVTEPGDNVAEVVVDKKHPSGPRVTTTVMRLGQQLYSRHDEWLVREGSERQKYWHDRFATPINTHTRRQEDSQAKSRGLVHAPSSSPFSPERNVPGS